MDIKQKYREETGLDVYRDNDAWNWEFSPEYVKWLEKAITVTLCCKSDSELLPKRLSNQAYKKAKTMSYNDFVKWCEGK